MHFACLLWGRKAYVSATKTTMNGILNFKIYISDIESQEIDILHPTNQEEAMVCTVYDKRTFA